ncbi:hypothetical protein FBUS_00068 [Fasciolopsis buskii]|uniref:SLC26A/SulP transporter domain-containing protein n=1 Tax=Fasciolopsis buskii TaxID=27845 RepID=A0A8E0RSJ3_9TREM|nr:hypothetical protein FBUS_00068 [Fasciolopsis buski]
MKKLNSSLLEIVNNTRSLCPMVAMGTIVSQQISLHEKFNVSIVGRIESGMPAFTVPSWSLMPQMIADAVIIGVTGTFLTVSLVKLFALKHKSQLNYNHLNGIASSLVIVFVLLYLGPHFSVTPTVSFGLALF